MKEIPISLFLFLSNFISVPKELAILLIWTAISTYLISDLIHLPLNQLLLSPDSLLLLLLLATFCCCHVPIKSQIGRDSSALCRSSNYRLAITGHRHTHTHAPTATHTHTYTLSQTHPHWGKQMSVFKNINALHHGSSTKEEEGDGDCGWGVVRRGRGWGG